jgi:hypothetical protein
MLRMKILDLPNGHRTSSDRITRVVVYPERSLSLRHVHMEIWEAAGAVYSGIVDLDRIVAAECLPSALTANRSALAAKPERGVLDAAGASPPRASRHIPTA